MAACLGNGVYTGQVRVVGSGALVADIPPGDILSGSWNRLNRSTSKAELQLPLGGSFVEKCCEYADIGKNIPALELYLWRDNGDQYQNVWVGPITQVNVTPGNTIEISAQDKSWWLTKRRSATRMFTGVDTNQIANDIINAALAINNPSGLTVIYENSGVLGTKDYKEDDGGKILAEVSDLVDGLSYWTCILDQFRIGITCNIPWTFTDSDVVETPPLIWDADFYATEVFGRGSGNAFGVAGGIDTTRFGIPILIQHVLDASSDDNTEALSAANKFLGEANSVGPRLQALTSALDPSIELDIMSLIPGCKVKAQFDQYCEPVNQNLYVTQCECSFSSSDEEVRIELSPTLSNRTSGVVAA